MKFVDRALLWGTLSGLFILPFVPLIVAGSLYFPFITGKAFTFRVIAELIFSAWLLLAIRRPEYRPKKSWLLWAFVGLIVTLTLSTIFGAAPFRSVWSNYERMEGLVNYFHLSAYFLVLISVLKTRARWYGLMATSLIANACVLVYTLVQFAAGGTTRLEGTLGNAAYLAVYVLIHIFLAVYLYVKSGGLRDWKIPTKFVLVLSALVNLFVLYHTATRGAILGFIAGAGFSVIYLSLRARGQSRKLATAGLLLLAILVIGFIGARNTEFVRSSPVLNRFATISLTETTTQSRFVIWGMSLRGVTERPLLGWGPENFNQVFNKYYEPILWRQEPWFDRSHNVFLDWLIIGGLPGLTLYLALYAIALFYVWRRSGPFGPYEKAILIGLLIGYFVHNIFVFDNLTSYILFLLILGYIHFRTDEHQPKTVIWDKKIDLGMTENLIIGGVILAVLCGGSYYLNFRPLFANQELIGVLRSAGDPEAYLAHMKKVIGYKTFGSNEAREQLFQTAPNILAQGGVSQQAKNELGEFTLGQIEEHLAQNPKDARAYLIAGSFLSQVGQFEQALKLFTEALALSPNKQSILFQLGTMNFNLGRVEEGLVYFKKAFDLDPNYLQARSLYGLGLIYNDQAAEGLRILSDQKDEKGNKLISARVDDRVLGSLIKRGRTDLARQVTESAIIDAPLDPNSYFALARVEGTSGNQAGVMAAFERGITSAQAEIKNNPAGPQGYRLLADLAFKSGNNDLARRTIEAGRKNSPEFAREADNWLKQLSAQNT